MTRDEAVARLAKDVADHMELKDMICYVSETMEEDFASWDDKDLAEEWKFRFEDTELEKPNPFG